MVGYFGNESNANQPAAFIHSVNIETINIYKAITYEYRNDTFTCCVLPYFDEHEKRKANTGHAKASVY